MGIQSPHKTAFLFPVSLPILNPFPVSLQAVDHLSMLCGFWGNPGKPEFKPYRTLSYLYGSGNWSVCVVYYVIEVTYEIHIIFYKVSIIINIGFVIDLN